jgi:hypothetical protein
MQVYKEIYLHQIDPAIEALTHKRSGERIQEVL